MKPIKNLAFKIAQLLAIVTGILAFSLPAFAYEEDTHFNMTYVICRSVGLTADEALTVAAVDQGMDDSAGTVANGGIGGVIPNVDEEWMWHSLDGYGFINGGSMHASGILARRDQLFQAALTAPNTQTKLRLLGVFFHFQQDTWSHRHHYEDNHLSRTNYTTYNTPWGHAYDFHQPDRPPFDPVAALMNLEDGIVYARQFLKQGLGRDPGSFLANYAPQSGSVDTGWSQEGKYYHQISLSGAAPNSARSYLLTLIRTQIDKYNCSIDPSFGFRCTANEASVSNVRLAFNKVALDFQPYRSAGIPNPAINTPTTAQKVAAGYTNLTTAIVNSWFANSVTSKGKQILSAAHTNGSLEVFYPGTDSKIYHNWQDSSRANGWNGQTALGGRGNQIAAARNQNGALEIFYVGIDGKIYHNRQDPSKPNGWNGEVALGGSAKQIAAAKNKNGQLEIIYIGTDNKIRHNWEAAGRPNGWYGETDLSGSAKQITVATNIDGWLEIFYVGVDDRIYHNWQNPQSPGGWNGEALLGGSAKQIAAAANRSGTLEIFYIGTDNNIYHNWQDSSGQNRWNGEKALGGSGLQITAAANADGHLEIFYVGTDGKIYHNWQNSSKVNGWNGQAALGGSAKQISPNINRDGRLEIFYIGLNDVIYHNWQNPQSPNGWNGEVPL